MDITKLKKAGDLSKKVLYLIPADEITKLAKDNIIPHYVLRNPQSDEALFLFNNEEILEWLCKYNLEYVNAIYETKFNIVNFDSGKELKFGALPIELSNIENIYQINLSEVCNVSGIYFLCKNKKILYIGQTVNIHNRLSQHLKNKEFEDVFFVPVHRMFLDEVERSLINHFAPPLNKQSFSDSSYRNLNLVKEVINI